MLVKLKGIVLHTVKFGENSLIVTLYTDKSGRQSCILNSVRSPKTASKAGLLQPLFILDLEIYQKQSREIQRIKEIKNALPYLTIPFDIQKSTQAIFLAEILYKTLLEEENAPHLFHFLENIFTIFDKMEDGKANFHICFLTKFTEHLGILPDFGKKSDDGFFDLRKGELVADEPAHPMFMNRETTRLFRKFVFLELTELSGIKITKQQKELLLAQLIDYYHIHFENLSTIKSLPVLKEVFLQ